MNHTLHCLQDILYQTLYWEANCSYRNGTTLEKEKKKHIIDEALNNSQAQRDKPLTLHTVPASITCKKKLLFFKIVIHFHIYHFSILNQILEIHAADTKNMHIFFIIY